MDRSVLTITVAVFLSVFLAVLLMASGVGSALEELFVGNATTPQQTRNSDGASDTPGEAVATLQSQVSELEAELAQVRASRGETREVHTDNTGGQFENRVRQLERTNRELENEIAELHELVSLLQPGGGEALDLGGNVSAEEIARHLADSPALQSVVGQLQRQTEQTAAEVYERKRREEERAELVAQVERAREALETRVPQALERMTSRMELNEHAQSEVTDALVSFQSDLLDARLTAFDQEWGDERREQHVTTMRETTVATLTSHGVEAEQAERIVRRSERMSRFTGLGGAAARPQNLGGVRRRGFGGGNR